MQAGGRERGLLLRRLVPLAEREDQALHHLPGGRRLRVSWCVERWGGNDGPDDAIENCNDWSLLHILGCDDRVLTLFQQALDYLGIQILLNHRWCIGI